MTTKKAILILLLLVGSWVAYGQQEWTVTSPSKTNSLKLSIYAEAGLGLSFYHSTDESLAPDFSSAVGLVIGAGANLCFMDKVFLGEDKVAGQIGLSFLRAGFSSDCEKVRGNYLCVPLSVQYYPMSNLYAELVLQSCLNLGLSPEVVYMEGLFIDLEGHHANDFKIGLGAGYVLNAIPLGFSARFLFGTSSFAENLPWKGNLLQISLFYRFDI